MKEAPPDPRQRLTEHPKNACAFSSSRFPALLICINDLQRKLLSSPTCACKKIKTRKPFSAFRIDDPSIAANELPKLLAADAAVASANIKQERLRLRHVRMTSALMCLVWHSGIVKAAF